MRFGLRTFLAATATFHTYISNNYRVNAFIVKHHQQQNPSFPIIREKNDIVPSLAAYSSSSRKRVKTTTKVLKGTSLQVATSPIPPTYSKNSKKKLQNSAERYICEYGENPTDDETDEDMKVGILLLNLGAPGELDDVEGFLYNLFADRDIIPFFKGVFAPLQKYFAKYVSKNRAPKSAAAYESIGGSPLLKYTNQQADLLTKALQTQHGIETKAYVGMRYWYPFTEQALDDIRRDNINALVILPLYPHFSTTTSGSSLRVLQEEFSKRMDWYGPQRMRHTVVPSWYEREGYLKSMSTLINTELETFSKKELDMGKGERHILFSAHGVPNAVIEAGDPYKGHIEECVKLISQYLPGEDEGVFVHLSYQSRVGPIEWLRPYTDFVLPELGEQGVKNIVVVPISFVSDNLETLEEIGIEYRELAEESGIVNWRRCDALNTDPMFINDMADMVMDALNEPMQSVTEACIANNVADVELNPIEENSGVMGGSKNLIVDENGVVVSQDAAAEAEKLNGRVAILGVVLTILVEALSGKSLPELFGFAG